MKFVHEFLANLWPVFPDSHLQSLVMMLNTVWYWGTMCLNCGFLECIILEPAVSQVMLWVILASTLIT